MNHVHQVNIEKNTQVLHHKTILPGELEIFGIFVCCCRLHRKAFENRFIISNATYVLSHVSTTFLVFHYF